MTPRATQPELKAGSSTRMARQPRLLLPIQVTLWLMIFTLACMTALAVWWVASRKGVSEFGSLARHLSPAIEPTVRHLRPGPWGELTGLRMFIPAPAEFIEDILAERPVAWRFPGHTADSLEDGLRRFGFSDQELELARSAPWEVTPAGVTIAPTDELVLELGADTRSRLYNFLADFPVNQHFRFTIVLSREAWDEILASEKIPARTTQLIRRLLYQRGDRLLLTDLALVARSLPEAKQRIALGELLATSETLNLRLTIRPGTDINALMDYWVRGWRGSEIRPLLESLTRVRGGADIDVLHLLPPFPRRLLYTFPLPSLDRNSLRQDCHWTSLNFFNGEPDDRFFDPGECMRTIREDYERTTDEPRFGDLVVIEGGGGVALHSAIYIADDIVFTKNGGAVNTPWMFMELPVLLGGYKATYNIHDGIEMHVLRRKPVGALPPATTNLARPCDPR